MLKNQRWPLCSRSCINFINRSTEGPELQNEKKYCDAGMGTGLFTALCGRVQIKFVPFVLVFFLFFLPTGISAATKLVVASGVRRTLCGLQTSQYVTHPFWVHAANIVSLGRSRRGLSVGLSVDAALGVYWHHLIWYTSLQHSQTIIRSAEGLLCGVV